MTYQRILLTRIAVSAKFIDTNEAFESVFGCFLASVRSSCLRKVRKLDKCRHLPSSFVGVKLCKQMQIVFAGIPI